METKLVMLAMDGRTYDFVEQKLKIHGFGSIEEFFNEKLIQMVPEINGHARFHHHASL